jgi:hypothetical protein
MTPTQKQNLEPCPRNSTGPFTEPQTIPAGWDVSAFYAPERESEKKYGSERSQADSFGSMAQDDENTEYTF